MPFHPWASALGDFRTAQRAAHRSPGTIRTQAHYLNKLPTLARSPGHVTTSHLLGFLAVDHWSAATRKSARTAVRSFFRWLYQAGRIDHDPAEALPAIRVPEAEPNPVPELVYREALLAASERVRLMLLLAGHGGLRAAEVSRVHADHLAGDVLVVLGKGGKTRHVPIVQAELLARLQAVDGYAFPNPTTGKPLTPGHVSRLMSEAILGAWSGHKLRTRAGTAAYAGTRDLLAVMQFLGHSRPETTRRYIKLPDDAVRAAARAAAA